MADLILPRGELKVLQAEDKEYKRGVLMKLLDKGGYKMAYWLNKPDKPYPVEIIVDGKSVAKAGKVVHMKFHPKDYYDKNVEEGWSKKYKSSIDCNNPKGFSQKAHCAGRKKQENKMSLKLEELVGKPITEQQFDEAAGKKDACYHKVKARYDVWPSAYASGALVKCRKVGAKNWGNKSKKEGINEGPDVDLGKKLQKIQKQIYALGHSYSKKANVPAMMNSFLIGLKMNLKKGKLLEGYPGKSIKPLHDDEVNENIKKLIGVAVGIAKDMSGNMTGAVKKIEKISKGLSKLEPVQKALRQYNEGFASDAQRRAAFASGYEEKGKKKKKKENIYYETTTEGKLNTSHVYWESNGVWEGYTFEFTNELNEAEYQGRKVKLNKIMQGDQKKFKVYVKNPKGNVVKVNFGQGGDAKGGTMRIRKSNPKARANFRARHNCDNPGPKHKARYWSCRKW